MCARVPDQRADVRSGETAASNLARKRLLARVGTNVPDESAALCRRIAAIVFLARKRLLASVCAQVASEINALSRRERAALFTTHERPLARVHASVPHEVCMIRRRIRAACHVACTQLLPTRMHPHFPTRGTPNCHNTHAPGLRTAHEGHLANGRASVSVSVKRGARRRCVPAASRLAHKRLTNRWQLPAHMPDKAAVVRRGEGARADLAHEWRLLVLIIALAARRGRRTPTHLHVRVGYNFSLDGGWRAAHGANSRMRRGKPPAREALAPTAILPLHSTARRRAARVFRACKTHRRHVLQG